MSKKEHSELVQSVMSLDNYFSELDRLGSAITGMDLKSKFDFDHSERLIARFAECGEGVSSELVILAKILQESRARAEATAAAVFERASHVGSRKNEEQQKMEELRLLGEKVRELNASISHLKRSDDQELTVEDRAEVATSLKNFDAQLLPLIEEAQLLKRNAQESKMKTLESNADSLAQSLQAVRQKVSQAVSTNY